jgi:hypothetical protein
MKCFEKLVKNIICSSLPASFDPLQFAYRANRSTEDAISNLMHTTLTHLEEGNGNYVRMLFIDFSSAFNTYYLSLPQHSTSHLGHKDEGLRTEHHPVSLDI